MKKATIIISLLFLLACNKGVWVTKNVYRPKHPRFSISKKPFKANKLINNSLLYVSTKRFVNYDGNILIGYMGFYADGRMIIDNTWEKEMNQTLNERNSFKTASSVGYYTTKGDTIKMEYFLPGEGGRYEIWEGLIKTDTIVLFKIKNFPFLQNKENRYVSFDTLVKSSYPLQDN